MCGAGNVIAVEPIISMINGCWSMMIKWPVALVVLWNMNRAMPIYRLHADNFFSYIFFHFDFLPFWRISDRCCCCCAAVVDRGWTRARQVAAFVPACATMWRSSCGPTTQWKRRTKKNQEQQQQRKIGLIKSNWWSQLNLFVRSSDRSYARN